MATVFSWEKEHLSKTDSIYQRCLLQFLVFGDLQTWLWVSMVLKRSMSLKTGANQGMLWLLYRLFGMKPDAVVWAQQRCRFLGECTPVLASEYAFEGIWFDAWLCYFVILKLGGHECITFASRWRCGTLMAGFKQEKFGFFFYPSRANWEVNHAEMSKVIMFIPTASSDWGGDFLVGNTMKTRNRDRAW